MKALQKQLAVRHLRGCKTPKDHKYIASEEIAKAPKNIYVASGLQDLPGKLQHDNYTNVEFLAIRIYVIEIMRFKKGVKVEVFSKIEVPSGSWHCFEIISDNGQNYTSSW